MTNGEKTKEQRIANRHYLINSLDDIIKESVYYRNNSEYINVNNRVALIDINKEEIKVKIL